MVLNDTIKHCFYCEREFIKENYGTNKPLARTRDHIVPLSKKGKNHRSNMVYACTECNHFKGDLLLELFTIKVENYIENNRTFKRIPLKLLPTLVANIKRLQDYIAEHKESPHTQARVKKQRLGYQDKKESLVGGYLERKRKFDELAESQQKQREYQRYLQYQTIEQFRLAEKHGWQVAKLLTDPESNFHE